MVKAYLAGDMLKKGSQLLRAQERTALEEVGTLDVFNPMDQKDINDKKSNPTAEAIFAKDTAAMLAADVIIADIDNNSVGTTAEMGQMWGVNYMLNRLHEIWNRADKDTDAMVKDGHIHGKSAEIAQRNNMVAADVLHLLMEIPVKQIHWQTTDVRDTDIPEAGHRRSHSLNQYLHGMMLDLAGEAKSFDKILEELQ